MPKCVECNAETRNPKFCSRSCNAKHRNRTVQRQRRIKIAVCRTCGVNFPLHRTAKRLDLSRAYFCSDKCRGRTSRTLTLEAFGQEWESGQRDGSQQGKHGYANKMLKRWLILSRGEKCEQCGWAERNPVTGRVPIEMDHIDGNRKNNGVGNVRLLCPNCHSLTPTWKSLNKKGVKAISAAFLLFAILLVHPAWNGSALPAKVSMDPLTPVGLDHKLPDRGSSPRVETHRAPRASRSRPLSPSAAWARTHAARLVANCESGDRHAADVGRRYNGNPKAGTRRYRGKWAMGWREWSAKGGHGDPADAPESEQDYRAWLLWKDRGWQPWSCSRIMGVR